MNFLVIKALHLIFVVTWFAGLFYLVRLYVYHAEANLLKADNQQKYQILHQQFSIMEKRLLFGITWPSAVLTLIFGSMLATQYWPLTQSPWLVIKLAILFLLYIYHFSCHRIFRLFESENCTYSSDQMRLWNEVPTIFLFAIIFLAVLRDSLQAFWALGSLIIMSLILFISIRLYRNYRKQS